MIHSHRWMAALAAITVGCAAAAPALPPVVPADRGETTVYIVRHAEKSTENPSDPELSKAGYARADSLASQLREAGVNVIITTQLKRTILTARPLARMRGIVPEVVSVGNPASAHIDSVVAAVRRHQGGTIVVVGHSNTVGHIAAALGGDEIGDLCDNEYSGLIILSIPRSKPTKMLVEHYGLADAPAVGSCVPRLSGQ
ncbi:MAG: phosphoglycerate mutase family protein [Gemmatimonadaceae bacterium]